MIKNAKQLADHLATVTTVEDLGADEQLSPLSIHTLQNIIEEYRVNPVNPHLIITSTIHPDEPAFNAAVARAAQGADLSAPQPASTPPLPLPRPPPSKVPRVLVGSLIGLLGILTLFVLGE